MAEPIPESLRSFFWDVDFDQLSWTQSTNFITRRILQRGDWSAILWLRSKWGDAGLRDWIDSQQGAGLSPRQIRFWEVVLDLEPRKTDAWIQKAKAHPWEGRMDG
jgi:hypothetical protein